MGLPLALEALEHASKEFEGAEDFQNHQGIVASVHIVICVIFS